MPYLHSQMRFPVDPIRDSFNYLSDTLPGFADTAVRANPCLPIRYIETALRSRIITILFATYTHVQWLRAMTNFDSRHYAKIMSGSPY